MKAPVITRHRRPFLAPLWIAALTGVLVSVALVVGYRSLGITTVVLVRHAEKELSTIEDPPLAPEGELRAQRLSLLFGRVTSPGSIAAVYVSDTRRSMMTAMPLAARLRVEPVIVAASDVRGLAQRVMRDHKGRTVLIVAHSNTLPQLVKHIANLDIAPIGDDEFDNIYVVSIPTLGKASVLRMEY